MRIGSKSLLIVIATTLFTVTLPATAEDDATPPEVAAEGDREPDATKAKSAKTAKKAETPKTEPAKVEKAATDAALATPAMAPEEKKTAADKAPEAPAATMTTQATEALGAVSLRLEDVLRSVIAKNAQIREAQGDVDVARAQLERARAGAFPKGEAILVGAAIPEETGDALHSKTNLSHWGPIVRVSANLAQPLFTFGQLGGYRTAAENQIVAKSNLADVKRNSVLQTAKEYYYGFAMAKDLEKLVDGLVSFLEEAVNSAEEGAKKKNKKDAVKPHDLYRLRIALEDLRQKKLYAAAGLKTARRAVEWMSVTPDVDLKGVKLEPERHSLKPLDEYIKMAKEHRPELKALEAGQAARAALRDAKRAQSYPTVFVAGFIAVPWAPTRQKQDSVFAWDPYNQISGGGGLGLRLDLEFARHSAEASEEQAEMMKLKATADYATPGIELEVRKAYWEVEQGREGLTLATKRRDMAKKWFVSNAMGWSVGVTQAKDLLESLQGEGEAKQNYVQTVYALNVALGKLSQAVGQEITELKYR